MKDHQLGDAPIEEEYIEQMTIIARSLDQIFNGELKGGDRKVGFLLMVFNYGDGPGRCNYVSNGANREDVVVMLKEQIKRFEGQPELKGTA
jgi:hypothetical protein